jgi:hypothetical protein
VVWAEFMFFVAGLAGLVSVLIAIGVYEGGGAILQDAMHAAGLICAAVLVIGMCASFRWLRSIRS